MFKGALLQKLKLSAKPSAFYTQSTQSFARYFNRAQEQDQSYKYDMTSYQYKPELIYKVDPSPQYPDGKQPEPRHLIEEREKFKNSLERFRDGNIAKRRQRDRFMTGRLFAHVKQEELKQQV